MKKRVYGLYICCIVCALCSFVWISISGRNIRYQKRTEPGYVKLEQYEWTETADPEAAAGFREEYRLRLPEQTAGSLIFFTRHQGARVWLDGELLYRFLPGGGSWGGKTPGNSYHTIPVEAEDAGKELLIELIPAYDNVRDVEPVIYLGSRLEICMALFREEALAVVLSIIGIGTGLGLLCYMLCTARRPGRDKSLWMLGLFTLFIGTWKFLDLPVFTLFWPAPPICTYGTFLALLLATVPFVLFCKELYRTKENPVWYWFCLADIVMVFGTIVMQMTGVAELRELLWMNHLFMAGVCALVVGMTVYEIRKTGWSRQLKLMIACPLTCLAGMSVDLMRYYRSGGSGNMVLAMLGLLLYIGVLLTLSVRRLGKRVQIGMRAEGYRKLAMHDEMTGMYNRSAYMEYIRRGKEAARGCIVAMMDLNNLKACNDTFGHEKGDRYLTESARLIRHVFGEYGKCCRIGGDEFCVLLHHISKESCEYRKQLLEEETARYNAEHPEEFPIHIACGYAAFDEDEDYDLSDTVRRADRNMYRNKLLMKRENAG